MKKISDSSDTSILKIRKRRKRIIIAVICLILLAAAGVGGWLYVDSLAYKVCRVEAGVVVTPSDFLKEPDADAFFTEDSQSFVTTEPGEYHVKVKSGLFTHSCTLFIEDTIAPTGEAVPVKIKIGETCEAECFVTNIADATQVMVSYAEEPDFAKAGSQSVRIALTDKGNNQTVLEAELYITRVVESVTVEAGEGAPDADRFVIAGKEASFITPVNNLDYTKVGEHEVLLKVDGETYTSILCIADTVPPKAEVQDIEGFAFLPRKAEEFVTETEDVTEVTVTFKEEPDLSLIGTQEVEIVVTDSGNNETIKRAKLTLIEDTEEPVILDAKDLTVFIGDSVSYRKKISVEDNCPEGTVLTVDTSSVDLNTEGVYPVIYTARDAAGNTASVTVNITVRARVYDMEEVYALADAVLADITTPEMSEWDKALAIYNYNVSHIAYINYSEKGDWVQAAYEGLALGKGDCYVYACTAKALLTRAGIANMDITKIPTRTSHYWNLVDVGDGWYHFDTTPRKDHPKIFMWTEAQLMEYSAMHYNTFNYDHSEYPEVN